MYTVQTVTKPIKGSVSVPGSKSMTNRALLMAALAEGKTTLNGVLFSDDSRYFLKCLQSLGFEIEIFEEEKYVTIEGTGGIIPNKSGEIYVGSAGTAARFLTAMLACSDGTYIIQASNQMKARPMKPLLDALTGLGASFMYLEKEGCLPVLVKGCGHLIDEEVHINIDISKSTQFLSALMMIAPMLQKNVTIHITSEKKDGAYIRITRKMMEEYGCLVGFDGSSYKIDIGQKYKSSIRQIEPDVSAACYFWAMAVLTGGSVLVKHVHYTSMQGDMKFLSVLQQMGAKVEDLEEGIRVTGPKNGVYHGVDIDMNDFSDQTMTLSAIASFAKSKTIIRNVAHIRLQESNRILAIVTELNRMGISCEETADGIIIQPGKPKSAQIQTYDDHRMAMAFALIGLCIEGISICNPECCKKTFETYFQVLENLTNSENML
jgi:3-phosphoshikimate 1-carboxyvinyltransferase